MNGKTGILYLKFIAISILIIIMGGNNYNSDYNNYEHMYYMSKYFRFDDFDYKAVLWYGYSPDIGYTILNRLFLTIDIDYSGYKLITSAILLIILFACVDKMAKGFFIVIILYVLYPFIVDVIQVRNFFIEVITIIVFYIYWKYQKKYWCIFLVFTGSLFHSSLLVILPFFVFDKYFRSKMNFISKLFIILGVIMPLYAQWLVNVRGGFFIPVDFMKHYNGYVNEEISFGYLLMYLYTIIPLVVLLMIKKYKWKYFDFNEKEYVNSLLAFYKYICCLLPLAIMVTHLSRLPRNILLLFAVVLSIYISKIKGIEKIMVVTLTAVMFYLFGYLELYRTDIDYIAMVLDNNEILYSIIGR